MHPNKFLHTHQLNAAILEIVEEARAYCILATPHFKIWPALQEALLKSYKRGVRMTFIIEQDHKNERQLQKLNREWGFEVYEIKGQHIKLYLNEKKCLLSSMNLQDSSELQHVSIATWLDPTLAKKEIVDRYVLANHSKKHHPGRIVTNNRPQQQVLAAKIRLAQLGYCVDCCTEITGDFKRNPDKIRCTTCEESHQSAVVHKPLQFCHWCGGAQEAPTNKPLHEACQEEVVFANKMLKPFYNY